MAPQVTTFENGTASEEANVRQRILSVCNELAFGVQFCDADIEISKFKSGFMSEIYKVTLTKSSIPATIPSAIVIKFYNTSASKEETGFDIINSQLNNLLISQASLGPRILLIRRDAIVMEAIYSEPLSEIHDQNAQIRQDIAQKLARLHSLPAPVSRNQHTIVIDRLFNFWCNPELLDAVYNGPLKAILEQYNLPHFLKNNFKSEANFVENTILTDQSTPTLVYSHRDFNHANLLVATDPQTSQPAVCFIDFDLSQYFYRGADIGRYFVDCRQPEQFHGNELIGDEEMVQFIDWYRQQSAVIFGKSFLEQSVNSTKQILKEAKLFTLFAYMMDIIFCLFMAKKVLKKKMRLK